MTDWLRKLFGPSASTSEQPAHFEGPYRTFTNDFDQQVVFSTSDALRGKIQIAGSYSPPNFAAYLAAAVHLYENTAQELVRDLAKVDTANITVTLLLDHSGSLRGEPSCLLATLAGAYSECLSRLNIAHEVLAFTTSSWRGGKSYQRWKAMGAPSAPGRLCDLLHIVYHSADRSEPISLEALRQMTDPWLLKENVDGEALLWALRRIQNRPEQRRILFLVSDGAPVDDATLLANGPNILDDHLHEVMRTIVSDSGVELYGVGIQHRTTWPQDRYYPQYFGVDGPQDISDIALPVLGAILSFPAHAPTAKKVEDR